MSKKRRFKLYLALGLILVSIISVFFLNEKAAQIISLLSIIGTVAVILVINLEKAGFRQLILMALPLFSSVLKEFSESYIAKQLVNLYMTAIKYFYTKLGMEFSYTIGGHTALIISFWLIVCVFYGIGWIINCINKNKESRKSNPELREKSFKEKCDAFCIALQQRIETINRKTNWNESTFTPLEAEVEVSSKGKRKRRYDDLLKCLKNNKRNKTVFLVLGDPGSGKSVSLRKLCSDLLKEHDETNKISVYIDLKKWNKDWSLNNLPTKNDLIEFIRVTLKENGDFLTEDFLEKYFDKMLADGRWYFIFDSFDELPCLMGNKNCQQLIDNISNLLYEFLTGPNQNGGVIASRLYKSPTESLKATVELRIQEFSDIKIKTMLQKYLIGVNKIVKELFGKREDLVVLCRNPFYLSLLINYIKEKAGAFPENQVELYRSFVDDRLKKCQGRMADEKITEKQVKTAAMKLAVYMQNSTEYGLECPARVLYKKDGENYWIKALRILEYAKICRFGGSEQTVSFVHRRFQEFFFVENIIKENKTFKSPDYNGILNNTGLRDALVLYCEIAEEEKVKEIASFCWDIVKENIKQKASILNEGCVELVNTLYFMAEAFRNRKSAIEPFLADFQNLVEHNLNDDTDFVVLHALTNSMVLFEKKRIQSVVLNIFKLENRWLSDIVMKNCRIINKLDYRVKREFRNYFKSLNTKTFFERFLDNQFSLSLTKSFSYIKNFHLSLLISKILMGITSALAVVALFIPVLDKFNLISVDRLERYANDTVIGNQNPLELISMFLKDFGVLLKEDFPIMLFLAVLFIMSIFPLKRGIMNNSGLFLYLACIGDVLFAVAIMQYDIPIARIWIVAVLFFVSLNLFIEIVPDFCYIVKNNGYKIILKWLKIAIIGFICFVAIFIFIITGVYLVELIVDKIKLLSIIIMATAIIYMVCFGLYIALSFIKDLYKLSHQPELKRISRSELTKNLNDFNTTQYKQKYVDMLLQKKVELINNWPDNVRPNFSDDELVYKLAVLDCMNIKNFNNRF